MGRRCVLAACIFLSVFLSTASLSPGYYQQVFRKVAWKIAKNATWRLEFERQRELSNSGGPGVQAVFPCKIPKSGDTQVPSSVHKLTPSDIQVIAALGDSVTAGNGIDSENAVEVLREFRGEAWSIGGDSSIDGGVHTLANVLRKYNPNLKGFSTGYGRVSSEQAWFNAAVPSAEAEHLPSQADDLIKKMKSDTRINWQNDWKIITILIGGNDMCLYCHNLTSHSPEAVGRNVKTALDKLHAQVPRALINLVPMVDATPIPQIKWGWFCRSIQRVLCGCALDADTKDGVKKHQMGYYQQLKNLANGGRYDTRDDFTVVLQPFLVNQDFVRNPDTGDYDQSYIAPDCLHPNRKCHQGLAVLLWNSMIVPVGEKKLSVPNDELINLKYSCPKEGDFIFTNKNSS